MSDLLTFLFVINTFEVKFSHFSVSFPLDVSFRGKHFRADITVFNTDSSLYCVAIIKISVKVTNILLTFGKFYTKFYDRGGGAVG